jgi:hypothetical protein
VNREVGIEANINNKITKRCQGTTKLYKWIKRGHQLIEEGGEKKNFCPMHSVAVWSELYMLWFYFYNVSFPSTKTDW